MKNRHLNLKATVVLALTLSATAAAAQPQPSEGPLAAQEARSVQRNRAVCITSNTGLFKASMLEGELLKNKEFAQTGLAIVGDCGLAELEIAVEYTEFTFDYSFKVTDRASSVVIAAGVERALVGSMAASGIAKKIVKALKSSGSNTPKEAVPEPKKKAVRTPKSANQGAEDFNKFWIEVLTALIPKV